MKEIQNMKTFCEYHDPMTIFPQGFTEVDVQISGD